VFIFVRRRTENTNAICEKTAGLRSGNFSDLNSACSKMLVTVKIFQFHDILNENRFLGTFLGHGKRPMYQDSVKLFKVSSVIIILFYPYISP
jgi:hypothetical protein